jgi:hypothetical protein
MLLRRILNYWCGGRRGLQNGYCSWYTRLSFMFLIFRRTLSAGDRVPGAPLLNRVTGCSQEGHFDSERVADCPPPSCSALCFLGSIPAVGLQFLIESSLGTLVVPSFNLINSLMDIMMGLSTRGSDQRYEEEQHGHCAVVHRHEG